MGGSKSAKFVNVFSLKVFRYTVEYGGTFLAVYIGPLQRNHFHDFLPETNNLLL